MKTKCVFFVFSFVLLLFAAVPKEIMYQGYLLDNNKNPFADGNYKITFKVFNVASGGATLWEEEQTITVKQGLLSATIGSTKSGGINLAFDSQYWLGVFYNDQELLSRIKIGSTPYALRSAVADSAVTIDGVNIKSASIDSSKIRAGSLSGVVIANNAVDSNKIRNASIASSDVSSIFKAPFAGIADSAGKASFAIAAGSVDLNSHIHFALSKKGKIGDTALVSDTAGNIGIKGYFRLGTFPKLIINSGEAYLGRAQDDQAMGTMTVQLGGAPGVQTAFNIIDREWTKTIFRVSGFAPINSFTIDSNGWVGVGTNAPSSYGHGGTCNIIELHNKRTALHSQTQLVVSTGSTLANTAIGGLSAGMPNATHENKGVGYVAFASGPSCSAVKPTGEFWVATRGATDNGWVNRMQINELGNTLFTGTVTANTTLSSSDIRFKTNIDTLKGALHMVESLQGVTYTWNKQKYPEQNFPDGKQVGVIAQDVEKIIPEIVHTSFDGYKAVAYDKLTAVLIEAVKEQQKEISELKNEINTLKISNSEFEKRIAGLENK